MKYNTFEIPPHLYPILNKCQNAIGRTHRACILFCLTNLAGEFVFQLVCTCSLLSISIVGSSMGYVGICIGIWTRCKYDWDLQRSHRLHQRKGLSSLAVCHFPVNNIQILDEYIYIHSISSLVFTAHVFNSLGKLSQQC